LRLEISIGALSAPGRLTLPLGGIAGVDATTPRSSAEARGVRREGPAFSAPGAFTQSRQLAPRHFGDRANEKMIRAQGVPSCSPLWTVRRRTQISSKVQSI